jgi:hypothetical protein
MVPVKLLASLAAVGAVAPVPAPSAAGHSLYASRQLWATVDVCNPKDQPNTIGIRGSMPSDGRRGDAMFMRFRVQYQNSSTKKWVDIAKGPGSQGADSGLQPVHPGGLASESGRNFQMVPTPGAAFTLRGVVSFEWRRGIHVVHSATRVTTAGHKTLTGADPAGFSAAICTIG